MTNKLSLFGIEFSVIEYGEAIESIIDHAVSKKSFGVSTCSVSEILSSLKNKSVIGFIKNIDMVLPDGFLIRYALKRFYNIKFGKKLNNTQFLEQLLEKAERQNLKLYLFGSTPESLTRFCDYINAEFPFLTVCGIHVDRLREASRLEDGKDIDEINNSNANLVLFARGNTAQDVWLAEHVNKINAAIISVSSTFNYLGRNINLYPAWIRNKRLFWLYKLLGEPKELWKKYVVLNFEFLILLFKYKFIIRKPAQ
jgi:N-acetylglucosaminyldiphosphoundecaprenol N-acetyl-beta-D-mannosaminyltransferase